MALRALVQRRASPTRPSDEGRDAPTGAAIRAPVEAMPASNAYGPRSASLARSLAGAP
jgi:hypothetical protein